MNDIVKIDQSDLTVQAKNGLNLTENPHQQAINALDISPDIQAILDRVDLLNLGK